VKKHAREGQALLLAKAQRGCPVTVRIEASLAVVPRAIQKVGKVRTRERILQVRIGWLGQ